MNAGLHLVFIKGADNEYISSRNIYQRIRGYRSAFEEDKYNKYEKCRFNIITREEFTEAIKEYINYNDPGFLVLQRHIRRKKDKKQERRESRKEEREEKEQEEKEYLESLKKNTYKYTWGL